MFRYKTDVLWELKVSGYSTHRLREEKILGGKAIEALRKKDMVGIHVLERICRILDKQPGDLIEYVPEEVGVKEGEEIE